MAYERDVGKTAYRNVSYINVNNPRFLCLTVHIYGLFNDSANTANYIMLNHKWLLNNQLEKTQKRQHFV